MTAYRIVAISLLFAMCGCVSQFGQSSRTDAVANAIALLRIRLEVADVVLPPGAGEIECVAAAGTTDPVQQGVPVSLRLVDWWGRTLFETEVALNTPTTIPLPEDAGPFFHIIARAGPDGGQGNLHEVTIFRGRYEVFLTLVQSAAAQARAAIDGALAKATTEAARRDLERRETLVAFAERWFAEDRSEPTGRQLNDLEYMSNMLPAEAEGHDFMLKGGTPSHLALFKQPAADGGNARSMRYWVHLPGDYASRRDWPLVIFLHGSTSSPDMVEPYRSPLPAYPNGVGMPCVCVAPKAEPREPGGRGGWDVELLNPWLDEVLRLYDVDPDRVAIVGHSMGAGGTVNWVTESPERFAAFTPMSGSRSPLDAQRYAHIPARFIGGADDSPGASVGLVNTAYWMRRFGGSATVTMQPYGDHMSVFTEFHKKELWQWMTNQVRKPATPPENVPVFDENGLSPVQIVPEPSGTFVYSELPGPLPEYLARRGRAGVPTDEYKYALRNGLEIRRTITLVRRWIPGEPGEPVREGDDRTVRELGVFVDGKLAGAGEFMARQAPPGDVAVCYYHGPLDGLEAAFERLRAGAVAKGGTPLQEERVVLWEMPRMRRGGPQGGPEPSVFLELQVPVAPPAGDAGPAAAQ